MKTLKEHNKEMRKERMKENKNFAGVSCDKCGLELKCQEPLSWGDISSVTGMQGVECCCGFRGQMYIR